MNPIFTKQSTKKCVVFLVCCQHFISLVSSECYDAKHTLATTRYKCRKCAGLSKLRAQDIWCLTISGVSNLIERLHCMRSMYVT